MPTLGEVVGSILAELTQARRIADGLTRELVEDYRRDPVLSGMTVPRAILGDVTIGLKFQVEDVKTAPAGKVAPEALEAAWSERLTAAVLPKVLGRFPLLSADERASAVAAVTTEPGPRARRARNELEEDSIDEPARPTGHASVRALRANFTDKQLEQAVQGKPQSLIKASVTSVLGGWERIPREIQRKIGGQGAFEGELKVVTAAELTATVATEKSRVDVEAALKSRLTVLVKGDDVHDADRVQSLTLTMRGADLDSIVSDHGA